MSLDRSGPASPLQHDIPMASVTVLAVDATRDWLIAGGWDGALTIWNLKTGALVGRFPVLCDASIQALAVSGNGKWLAVSEVEHQRLALYRLADLGGNAEGKDE